MIKYISPGAFGFDQPIAQMVKVASRGLRGNDLNAFIKRAGVDFLSSLDLLRPGEVPVHMLIVGAEESYGANRNADSFPRADCEGYHDTFAKYGHYFRDHQNKEGNLRYGRIVKTAFHRPMDRIELLVGLFGDEAAAERAGPLGRMAAREMEKLARGEEIPVSMACRVAYDVCSHCGNQARSKDEYCDTGVVKYAGRTIKPCSGFGCKHGLTKVGGDGRMQFVRNPRPVFFDASGVYRNADRIAYGLGTLEKAASALVLGGAAMAEQLGITAPTSLILTGDLPAAASRQLKLAVELALAERGAPPCEFDLGLAPGSVKVAEFPDVPPAFAFRALADAGVVLRVHDWMTMMLGKTAAAEAAGEVAARLPGVFTRMVADDTLGDALAGNPYGASDAPPPQRLRTWAAKLASDHGLGVETVRLRARRSALHGRVATAAAHVKAAGDGAGAEKLAREYAKYQLAFLDAPANRGAGTSHLTRSLLVRRNALV